MILLDTCALIWAVNRDPMSAQALKSIRRAAKAGELFLSPVSAWEIGILVSQGRLSLGIPADVYVARAFSRPGVRIAALSPLFSPRGEAKCVKGASVRGARRLTSGGVLDCTSSTASKRNEVMAGLSRASTVRW